MMNLNPAGALVYFCLFPLIVMIVVEMRARGPRPAHVSRGAFIAGFAIWPLMAVITFFFASLPALHAQLKLASGTGLIYRVAEKGSRVHSVPVAAGAIDHSAEPVGAVGGGV